MLPIIVIVGRPNVGKSTLFNRLTGRRDALVADLPGVTRDRQYGEGQCQGRSYMVVDTGGIIETDDPTMSELTFEQAQQALAEADQVFFMVDAQAGLMPADQLIADQLRVHQDKVVLLVNKADRESAAVASSEFYTLGFGEPQAISAKRGRGVESVMGAVLDKLPEAEVPLSDEEAGIRIAVIGRPNVGKSTLINRMLGEERVVVCDRPGTTRDSIFIPFERRGQRYTLIDTAGVRRRSKVYDAIEKFSVIKTLQAIDAAEVVVIVLDAREGVTEQDLRLIGLVVDRGKALLIAFNKWDSMAVYDREQMKEAVNRRLVFVDFARRYFISAKHGTGIHKLYSAIQEAYTSAEREMTTGPLTRALERAVTQHEPPLIRGRRIRLRYAHLGGHHPMVVVIHGKQTDELPESYQRYLAGYFRKAFQLVGVPVQIQLVNDANPYV